MGTVDRRVGRCGAVAVMVVALAVAAPSGAGGASSETPTVTAVVLPRDHGSHPGFGVEWWYTTGRLTDDQGGRYFYFATVWSAPMGLVARINVVDRKACCIGGGVAGSRCIRGFECSIISLMSTGI